MHNPVIVDGKTMSFFIRRPSNFHAHLRRDELMRAIAKHLMQYVLYLLVMPNTGPIKTLAEALAHYDELMEIARTEGLTKLVLIMTLYHTAEINAEVIEAMAKHAVTFAIKHYPPAKGLTTGSGLSLPLDDPRSAYMLDSMAANGIRLLGHFEDAVDKYNRPLHPTEGEAHYVTNKLWRIRDRHPDLLISCEHASVRETVEFVKADTSGRTVLTATPQHSLCTVNDLETSWGHLLKCKPYPQTEENRAVIDAFITSGDFRAIAGDDTAAHLMSLKTAGFEKAPFGAFWTWHSITAYAKVFERAGALHNLEKFLSLNGPRWWGLPEPANDDMVEIYRETVYDIPDPVPVPALNDSVLPVGWSTQPDRLQIGWGIRERLAA